MFAPLPQIPTPLKDELHRELFSYINTLSHPKGLYPSQFVADLQALLDSSGKCTLRESDTWDTGVPYTFKLSPLKIAQLDAKDIDKGSDTGKRSQMGGKPTSEDSDSPIQLGERAARMIREWNTGGYWSPIIRGNPVIVSTAWGEGPSKALGSIPIPRPSEALYWGTRLWNVSDTILYRGQFVEAGSSITGISFIPGDQFFFKTFGVSLWVIWPVQQESLRARPEKRGDLQWCLNNLKDPSVCIRVPWSCVCLTFKNDIRRQRLKLTISRCTS